MAQSDFSCLTFPNDENDFEFIGKTVQHSSLSRSGSLSKIVDDALPDYVPKNYMKPEVLSLIAAWEATMAMRIHTDTMYFCSYDSNQSEGVMQPPKRFYLTFWRSIVKRVLQQESEEEWNA